ncbi:MAG: hypothetical protein M1838_006080 [Thelocarpon superellum]|nr:MAG: hypothetical protein M1838_006080 [Thelocarpon superellum]
MSQGEDLLRRPFYVFDLPPQILNNLQRKDVEQSPKESESMTPAARSTGPPSPDPGVDPSTSPAISCALCGLTLGNVKAQREHVRSDVHRYNLKQRMRGLKPVTEMEFERMIGGRLRSSFCTCQADLIFGDLDESISGSDSSHSDEDEEDESAKSKDSLMAALLKRQAIISTPDSAAEDVPSNKRKRGAGRAPLWWFTTPALPSDISLGIYRAIFTAQEQEYETQIVETIRQKQLSPKPPARTTADASSGASWPASGTSPHIFLCMIGGGHFAGMVVSLAPKLGQKATGMEERQVTVLAHKTFHRYTTRRKQGGGQAANDASKGAAHSAGSSLRRYNEEALTQEVRVLLGEWKSMIDTAQLLFVRATGTTNRKTLFGPYDNQVLRPADPRLRTFPFSTRRATQAELMRAFVELTRVKVRHVDEASLDADNIAAEEGDRAAREKANRAPARPRQPAKSEEEQRADFVTGQLQQLVRQARAPAVAAFYAQHNVPASFAFHPPDAPHIHHASTPLHLAASTNAAAVIMTLLTKLRVDPATPNGEGRPAFDLAGERSTRDAFRVARHEIGEETWDWKRARVPAGLSREEADRRAERERKDAEKEEMERRKAELLRLEKEGPKITGGGKGSKGAAGGGARFPIGAQSREEQLRGMTPEMKRMLEREQRARAAEERMRRLQG